VLGEQFDKNEFQPREVRTQQQIFIDNGVPGRLADSEVSYAIGLRREQSWTSDCPVSRERMIEVVPGITIDVLWWCIEYIVKDATDDDPRLFRQAEKRLVCIFCTADTICYGANLPLVILGAAAAGVVSTTMTDAIPCVSAHSLELVTTLQAVADHANKLASSTTTILILKGIKFVIMSPLIQFLIARILEKVRTEKTVTDTIELLIEDAAGEDGGRGAVAVQAQSDAEDPPFATFFERPAQRISTIASPLASHVAPDETAYPFNSLARKAARATPRELSRLNMRIIALIGRHGSGIHGITCAYCIDDDRAHEIAAAYLSQEDKLRAAMDSLGKDIDEDVRESSGLFISHSQFGDAYPPNKYNAVVIPPGASFQRLELYFGMHSKHTLQIFWRDPAGAEHEARFGPTVEEQAAVNATHHVIAAPEGSGGIVGVFGSVGRVSRTLNVLGAYYA